VYLSNTGLHGSEKSSIYEALRFAFSKKASFPFAFLSFFSNFVRNCRISLSKGDAED